MFANLTGVHAIVILAVIILIFGASRLPSLARSLGQSFKILRDETSSTTKDEKDSKDSVVESVEEPVKTEQLTTSSGEAK